MGLLRQELIESPKGISHLIIVFASQVPFEPPLHRPVRWAGTERLAACEPIVVLGRVVYSGVQWCTVVYSGVQWCTVVYSVQWCTVVYSVQWCTVVYSVQ